MNDLPKFVFVEKPEEFHPVVEVAALFCQVDDEFLFLLRQPHITHGNTWGIPGGKVEKNETPHQAVVREFFEEVGVQFELEKVSFIQTVYITYPTHDFVYHMFSTTLSEKLHVTIDSKTHVEAKWLTLQQALELPLIPGEDECIELAYGITI